MLTFDHVTMAEIATIERISGQPIGAIMSVDAPKGNLMAAMALVAKRRTGSPDFTWEDAQQLTLKAANEANEYFRATDEPDELEQELAANAAADEVGLTTPDPDAVAFDEQQAADGRGNVEATPPASHPPID